MVRDGAEVLKMETLLIGWAAACFRLALFPNKKGLAGTIWPPDFGI